MACSSTEEPAALKQWFDDQGIATSYGKQYEEIDVSVSFDRDLNNSAYDTAYMVSSFAALGNVNSLEQSLYFGLEILDSISPVWKLRTDTLFYKGFSRSSELKELGATIYWLEESEFQHDTLWLKLPNTNTFLNSMDINLEWEKGVNTAQDTFFIPLPEELAQIKPQSGDTLRLLVYIRLHTDTTVLRIAPPAISDIHGLLRVAQKTKVEDDCRQCLYSGIRDSLLMTLEIDGNKEIAGKTVVFAELLLPKEEPVAGSELGLPVQVYVYDKERLKDYMVDTVYVKEDLKLQVTKILRDYTAPVALPETIDFTLRFGFPMQINDRPAYDRYYFTSETAKLRLWFADYDDKK